MVGSVLSLSVRGTWLLKSTPRPLKSPRSADLPDDRPPGVLGSWTADDVTTIRCGSFRFQNNRLANKKCPKWFTPMHSSKPWWVNFGKTALVDGATPAFRHKTWTLEGNCWAHCWIESTSLTSHTSALPPPAASMASWHRSTDRLAWYTSCPSWISRRAAANPIPEELPVIQTTNGWLVGCWALCFAVFRDIVDRRSGCWPSGVLERCAAL